MEVHFQYSAFREAAIEHIFIGDCLRRLWARGVYEVEVLKSGVDAAGYDVVMDVRGVLRHIQLKASYNGATVRQQTINGLLADKPSGCLIWIGFDEDTLKLGPFYWFGGMPGEALPDVTQFKRARHTKADATGQKAERRNSYVLKRSVCKKLERLDEVLVKLFGEVVPPA